MAVETTMCSNVFSVQSTGKGTAQQPARIAPRYAATKKGAEVLSHAYHHLYGIDVTVLRYFTVYGPAGRPDMSIFRFIQWINEGRPVVVFGDGTQERDYTYVDDIAEGTVAAAKASRLVSMASFLPKTGSVTVTLKTGWPLSMMASTRGLSSAS